MENSDAKENIQIKAKKGTRTTEMKTTFYQFVSGMC